MRCAMQAVSPRSSRRRLCALVLWANLWLVPAAVADDRVTELLPFEPGSTAQDACEGYPPYYGCNVGTPAGITFSGDGSRMFFTTAKQLTPGDTDTDSDLYVKSGGVVRLISTGSGYGSFGASSDDGAVVYWNTNMALVPEDTDAYTDIYREVDGGPPELVSTGPADNGNVSASGRCLSRDGSRFFFDTAGVLTTDDADSFYDTYEVSGGVTRLVTGNGVCPHSIYCGPMFRCLRRRDDGRLLHIEDSRATSTPSPTTTSPRSRVGPGAPPSSSLRIRGRTPLSTCAVVA